MLEFRRQVLESADSSNNVVKQALEAGEPEGLAVQARCQTGGYGRQGRGWSSPRGGMYMSLLLRPQVPLAQLPTLSLLTGLAVRNALRSLVVAQEGRCIVVKWPNDVVYCEAEPSFGSRSAGGSAPVSAQAPGEANAFDKSVLRKMCGISLESHAGGICIGIGVNVFPAMAVGEAAPVVGNLPLYLAELGYGHTCEQDAAVDAAAQAVLDSFAELYSVWLKEGFTPFAEGFSRENPLMAKRVEMVDVQGRPLACGTVQGVDSSGNLLLLTTAGLQAVSFGEAHIL